MYDRPATTSALSRVGFVVFTAVCAIGAGACIYLAHTVDRRWFWGPPVMMVLTLAVTWPIGRQHWSSTRRLVAFDLCMLLAALLWCGPRALGRPLTGVRVAGGVLFYAGLGIAILSGRAGRRRLGSRS